MKIKKRDITNVFDGDITFINVVVVILITIGGLASFISIIGLSFAYIDWDPTGLGEMIRGLSIGLFLLIIAIFKLEK